MNNCPACGTSVSADDGYCGHCGALLAPNLQSNVAQACNPPANAQTLRFLVQTSALSFSLSFLYLFFLHSILEPDLEDLFFMSALDYLIFCGGTVAVTALGSWVLVRNILKKSPSVGILISASVFMAIIVSFVYNFVIFCINSMKFGGFEFYFFPPIFTSLNDFSSLAGLGTGFLFFILSVSTKESA